MAWSNKTYHRDFFRYDYQYRRLPAIPYFAGKHGRILIQPADRAYLLASSSADRGDDVHSLPRLFFVESQTSTADRAAAQARFCGLLLSDRRMGNQSSLEGAARLFHSAGRRRIRCQPAKNRLFSKGPFLPFIP